MTTTIENLHSNKRKFISDDEVYPPLARFLPTNKQVDPNYNVKKLKSIIETERLPLPNTTTIDDPDDMMICEDSHLNENDTQPTNATTNVTQSVRIPKHCNGICNADASPTTLFIRCYCDPYRLNGIIPYDSDVY